MAAGPQYTFDGSTPTTGRQGKTGEAIVAPAHGELHEAASRGVLFRACEQAGVAPGTALGTTACLSLYNPGNSGKVLSVWVVGLGYISGTLGAGTVFHCTNSPTHTGALAAIAQPSGGTSLSIYPARLGGRVAQAGNASVAEVRSGSTVTTPVAARPLCSLQASLATTAVAPWLVKDWVRGEFLIEPGFCYQIQGITAAGSTPLVAPSVLWEEIPLQYA